MLLKVMIPTPINHCCQSTVPTLLTKFQQSKTQELGRKIEEASSTGSSNIGSSAYSMICKKEIYVR